MSVENQVQTVQSLRDLLLRKLLQPAIPGGEPAAVAASVTPEAASLVLSASGAALEVLTFNGSLDDLRSAVRTAMKERRQRFVQILVVGGGEEVSRCLRSLWPFWQISRRFGFHHVDSTGVAQRVKGLPLAELKSVVKALAATEASTLPSDAKGLADLVAHSLVQHKQESSFESAMQRRPVRVTTVLAVACIAIFGLEYYWGGGSPTVSVRRMGANYGGWVREGEIWRLLSSAFLHANVGHLFVNMIALLSFGPFLERLLGPRRFVVLYGLSALGGALASALLQDVVSVGASGAIWGLMLAGLGLVIRPRGLVPPLALKRMQRQVWVPVVINLMYSFQPGVDLYAHLGGGLVGLGLLASGLLTRGLVAHEPEPAEALGESRSHQAHAGGVLLSAAAVAASVAMAASVAEGLRIGRPWELLRPPARIELPEARLSLELPAGLERAESAEMPKNVLSYVYGDLGRDPIAIELFVAVVGGYVTPESLPAALDRLEADLKQSMGPDWKLVGTIRRERLGTWHTITFSQRNELRVLRQAWATVIGDREVLLSAYTRDEMQDHWKRMGAAVFRSLRDEAR